MTGIFECSVGVKINDEDKGRTAKGEKILIICQKALTNFNFIQLH